MDEEDFKDYIEYVRQDHFAFDNELPPYDNKNMSTIEEDIL